MVLFVLVMALANVIFPTQRPVPPPEETAAASDARPEPSQDTEAPPPAPAVEPDLDQREAPEIRNRLVEAGELEEIPIKGEGYSGRVRRRGGVVTSFVLHGYTDALDRPADLVRDPEVGLLGVTLNTPGGDVDLRDLDFHLETRRMDDGGSEIRLLSEDPSGLSLSKTYRIHPDSLTFGFSLTADGVPNGDGSATYTVDWGNGMPLLEVRPEYDRDGMATVALLGKDIVREGGRKGQFGCGGSGNRDAWETTVHDGMVRWAGVRNKYFVGALIPSAQKEGRVLSERNPGKAMARTSLRFPVDLEGRIREDYRVYLGPMKHEEMAALGVGLERAVDLGMKPIIPVSQLILWSMTNLYKVVPNYGLVILILSVLTKVIFYPLTKKSLDSMKGLQNIKPELEKINQKYKEDAQRRNQETMKLYKTHKINPLGGCLPMLVQMPIFFALYSVLYNVIELRKAPFFLWIDDLSIPDNVGDLFGIPINPLPVIMTGSMILQQRLTPTDPRQAMMATLMPVMFLFFFYNLPSGLVFYWTVNNVVSIIQQIWIKRGDQAETPDKPAQRRDYAVASRR